MRRIIVLVVCMSLLIGILNACDKPSNQPKSTSSNDEKRVQSTKPTETVIQIPKPTNDSDVKEIVVATYYDYVKVAMEEFIRLHPDFPYKIRVITYVSTGGGYFENLFDFGIDNPHSTDLAIIPQDSLGEYTKGKYVEYTTPYEELGLDMEALIKEADVEPYVVEVGKREDGKVVALSTESPTGAFFYRRSIAKEVWGTDEPAIIQKKVGGSWDNFLTAAEKLKEKGYAILSSYDDLLNPILGGASKGWVVDGKLYIDPKKEAFFDLAKTIYDEGYDTGVRAWSEEWRQDTGGTRDRQVFGYFCGNFFTALLQDTSGGKLGEGTYGDWALCQPINSFHQGGEYVVVNNKCKAKQEVGELVQWLTLDTSNKGYQYYKVNALLETRYLEPMCPSSKKVMQSVKSKKIEGLLGGQNIFATIASFEDTSSAKSKTQYDIMLDSFWMEAAREYVLGTKTKEQAIEQFKDCVKANYSTEILVE